MKTKIYLIFSFLWIYGCSKSVPDLVVRAEQVPTTIAVSIQDAGGFSASRKSLIRAKVRQDLIFTKLARPVLGTQSAQLLLVVKIIEWPIGLPKTFSWKLVDHQGGILRSGIIHDNANSTGFSVSNVSGIVIDSISSVDIGSFSNDKSVVFPEMLIEHEQKNETKKVETKHTYPDSQTAGEENFAIIVGVENYRNKIQPALYATNDALNMESLFTKTFNIPQKNVKLLLNDRASKTDILVALSAWLSVKNTKGANIFFYFSGHGSPKVDSGDAYILPYDANPTYLKSAGISVEEIQDLLKRAESKNTYIILDSCFSGNGARSILAAGTRPLVPVKAIESKGAVLFSASGTNQTTGIHSEEENGLFTYYLILGLSGAADENDDASVSIRELENYVSQNVEKAARRQNREQKPALIIPDKQSGRAHSWVTGLVNKKTK